MKKGPIQLFEKEKNINIQRMGADKELNKLARKFLVKSSQYKYSYNFSWLGRPIIQLPQDIVAIQELIWLVKPDCIIETGIAHGGSLILSSSMIELLHNNGKVIGIDIDIRDHNRKEINKHPLHKNIIMVEGSSIDNIVVKKVTALIKNFRTIMIFLDSNHSYEHVLKELELYSPLVSIGSYIVVFDTSVEFIPKKLFKNKPWEKRKNNPYHSVQAFLKKNNHFINEVLYENKLLITSCFGGFLKRIS